MPDTQQRQQWVTDLVFYAQSTITVVTGWEKGNNNNSNKQTKTKKKKKKKKKGGVKKKKKTFRKKSLNEKYAVR